MASDSFTDTNDTALTTHDSNWSFVAGDDYGRIYGNGVSYGVWSEAVYRYTGSNGNESILTIKAGANNGSSAKAAPSVRVGASTTGYHLLLGSISGGNYTYCHFYKDRNWQYQIAGTWSTSSDHTVRIVASGTSSPVTVTAYVDGSSVGSWEDSSSPYTSGYSGLYLTGDGSNDYAFGDDWSDGATAASVMPHRRIYMLLRLCLSSFLSLLRRVC